MTLVPSSDGLPNVPEVNFKLKTSKEFYVVFGHISTKDVPVITNYLKHYSNDDCGLVFHKKIVLVKEIKLNFFKRHGILSCKKNLKQFKTKIDDECDLRKEHLTIKHLLWDCLYVIPRWKIVDAL